MGDEGARAIATILHGDRANHKLQALDLWECGIGASGAEALARALHRNRGLRTLELRGNRIGDAGAVALADAMPHNGALSTLDLIGNEIGTKGRSALINGLHDSVANPYLVLFEDGLPHQQWTSWQQKGKADAP